MIEEDPRVLDYQRQLAQAQETIRLLQHELEETNRGLMALTMELEKRVDERTADLRRNQQILSEQREQYRVTLASIGDGVIATDAQGAITFMNPVAERLTGWPQPDALGHDIQVVFHIINERTRQIVANPITRVLEAGMVVGLANHTVLIARDGQEYPIDDSGAPIHDASEHLLGVVLVFRDISEQRQAENERRAYQEQLQQLIDSVPVLIASFDAEERYRFCNQALAAWYGRTPGEVRGKHFQEVVVEAGYRRAKPYIEQVLSGQAVTFENMGLSSESAPRNYLVSYVPEIGERGQVTGFIAAASDITERKQAEERLRQLQEVTAALAGTLTLSEVGAVFVKLAIQASGAAAGFLARLTEEGTLEVMTTNNYPEDEVRAWRHFPLDAPTPLSEAVRTAAPVWIDSHEAWRTRYGSPPVLPQFGAWAALPLMVKGKSMGGIGFSFAESRPFRDEDQALLVTLALQCVQAVERAMLYEELERRAAFLEQTVEQRTAELRQSLVRVEAADRAKTSMLSNVTHEMRTPLSSIVGFSNLLITRALSEAKQQEFTRAINQEGRRLTRLIDDFLDLQRIEAGRQAFAFAPVDLAVLVREEIDQLELEDERPSPICTECKPVPLIVADKEAIRRVVRNLLSNALKFSPEGEIALSVWATEHEVRFAIRDHGLGIPAEELGQLFQRFYRGEAAEQQRIQGTGLGLALCREIIEAHHGRIWAESPGRNQGANFQFALPYGEVTFEELSAGSPTTPSGGPSSMHC